MEELNTETTATVADQDAVAQTQDTQHATEQSADATKAPYFTARRIAYIAIFTAISFAIRQLSFPIVPAVSFLKFDFSDLFVLICGYALGPIAGLITGVLKEVLSIFNSGTAGVGELANIIVLVPFVLLPSIMYKRRKGIKSVIFWLGIACIIRVVWSFPVNYLLTFPVFLGFKWQTGMAFFLKVWYWVMLFNFIKTIILAALVLLLYKSVSRLINLINKKFDERKVRKNSAQS